MKKILIILFLYIGYHLTSNAQVEDGRKYQIEILNSDTTITFELSFVATHSSNKTGKKNKYVFVMWKLNSFSKRDGETYKVELSPDQYNKDKLFTDQAKHYLVYDSKNDILLVFESSN